MKVSIDSHVLKHTELVHTLISTIEIRDTYNVMAQQTSMIITMMMNMIMMITMMIITHQVHMETMIIMIHFRNMI